MSINELLARTQSKENILVAFSGGRTSGYMSKWLKDNMSHLYNFTFVFANTGLEHENNLHCTTIMKDPKVFDKSSIVVTKKNCSFFKGIK